MKSSCSFPTLSCTLILSLIFLFSCGDRVDCQAPPPVFYFQVKANGVTYPNSGSTSDIRIFYADGANSKTYISDLDSYEGIFTTGALIMKSHALNNPEITVELRGEPFAKLRLETFINTAKCQGWATVSKVYQDNKPLTPSSGNIYIITD
ncbi:hypothetical protein [Dyadobacter aurulentus]|uniref:hypothetical protein n=1 Tax=Dyadobacter sp. UC 10 TaxID=2605428 RepID=UPI0011F25F81|nr:hypothetical protein [Dyadobacter sp. UC 10]KAA0992721.1 hypothetical protein FXO21_22370 [Dyadobacter sp. UC 10]